MGRRFAAKVLSSSLAAWCLVTAARNARADSSNPNLIPLGENESFLGNAGVGRPNDTGAVYYNPAGLAEISSGRVALSGTVYASVSYHYDAIAVIQGTNIPFDASGFNAIPTALVGTTKLGDWVGAFSVLVPLSLQFDDHTTLAIPNSLANLVYSLSETEVWYGLSIARKLGEHFGVGLSVYGIQHNQTTTTGVDYVSFADGSIASGLAHQSMSVYGLLATLGFSYIASDAVRFGLRAQTAMVQIYGKGESYSIDRAFPAGAPPTASGENVTGAANYAIPFDFSLGTALKPADWVTLLGDVSLQLPSSYQEFPASIDNELISLKATPRFNLGIEAIPAPTYPLRLGFFYNPSTRSGQPGDPNFAKSDYYGLTAGVGLNSDHVRTSVGGFYIWSSGQATSTAPASAAVRITAVGAMLTTAYVF